MTQRLSLPEKKAIAVVSIVAAVPAIALLADFSVDGTALAYAGGVFLLAVAFEAYIYFTYVSDRFRSFAHAVVYIHGVKGRGRTCIDIDGRFVHRHSGECNGVAIRLPPGTHDITARNRTTSSTARGDIADRTIISIEVGCSAIEVEIRQGAAGAGGDASYGKRDRDSSIATIVIINVVLLYAIIRFIVRTSIL